MADLDFPEPGVLTVDVRDSHPRRVVLDAGALDHTDSSGSAPPVQVTRRTGQVQVRNPGPVIRQLTGLTGLSEIPDVVDENQP